MASLVKKLKGESAMKSNFSYRSEKFNLHNIQYTDF